MNALTIITTKTPRMTDDLVSVIRAVREHTATVQQCKVVARAMSNDKDLMMHCRYSYARALYRDQKSITVYQLSLLCALPVENVKRYLVRLKIAATDMVSADDATRVMFRIAD